MKHIYFANEKSETLVKTLTGHIDQNKNTLGSSVGSNWNRNLRYYYGNLFQGADDGLSYGGDQGELVKVRANQLRSLTRQFISLVSKNRLNFQATSQTSDTGNLADTRLINGLLSHIVGSQKLDIKGDMFLEHTACTGAGYIKAGWNTSKGPVVDVDEQGSAMYAGELELANVLPTDVIFDQKIHNFDDCDWVIVSVIRNRYDLIAQFPDLESAILRLSDSSSTSGITSYSDLNNSVKVFEFYHRPTPALPSGRLCVFGDDKTVFFDDVNPYKCIPIVQCKPEPIFNSPYGYTFLNDLVPLQELFDLSMSTAASNISAFGVQSMLVPEGADVSVKDIGGLSWISFKQANATGGGKPEPLQMPQTPQEVWRFGETIKTNMMEISNVNATLRGAPPSNVTSGTMAATLSANAVDFASTFAKAYYSSLESLMTISINIYRNFAKTPQIINIVGSNKAAVSKEFTGRELPEISKVTMRVASPLLSTSAGVSDIAEKLLNAKLIRSAQELLEVITTGNLESLYDADLSELELINAENDQLRDGIACRAINSDIHNLHIVQHKQVVNDPKLRTLAAKYNPQLAPQPDPTTGQPSKDGNPENIAKAYGIIKATLDHITEHLQSAQSTDPMLLGIIQTGALPPPQPQPQQQPPPQGK